MALFDVFQKEIVPDDPKCIVQLKTAIDKSNYGKIKKMLKHGLRPDYKYPNSYTNSRVYPLHIAINEYAVDAFKMLVDACPDINFKDGNGNPLLITVVEAAKKSYEFEQIEKMVQFLCDSGADPNIKDREGENALFHIEDKKLAPIFNLLVNTGADVNLTDGNGRTPLENACKSSLVDMEIFDMLIEAGADPSHNKMLRWAMMFNRLEKVEKLIDAGADLSALDTYTLNQVCSLQQEKPLDKIRIILDAGVDPNHEPLALHQIALCKMDSNHLDFISRPLSTLDQVTGKDYDSAGAIQRYIHLKCQFVDSAIRLLFKYGADLDRTDKNGQTALHIATSPSREETASRSIFSQWLKVNTTCINTLLELGANQNIVNNDGNTPKDCVRINLTLENLGSLNSNSAITKKVAHDDKFTISDDGKTVTWGTGHQALFTDTPRWQVEFLLKDDHLKITSDIDGHDVSNIIDSIMAQVFMQGYFHGEKDMDTDAVLGLAAMKLSLWYAIAHDIDLQHAQQKVINLYKQHQ